MSSSARWDAIVIGSGLGELTAAAYLTAAGERTLLLEQYDVVGGCSHVFRRKREWEFEVGVHYLGDCGPGGQIPTILRGLGLDDRIEFLPMDPDGFDTLCYPDVTLRVPKGWDNYLANVIDAFPGEERAIRRYLGIMRRLGEALDRSATPASLGGMATFAARGRLASAWAREVRGGLVLGDSSKLKGGGPGWDPLLASKRMSRKPRAAAVEGVAA